MSEPHPVCDPVDLAREIIAGQTGRLTRYVRALDYASALLAKAGLFETPEEAREWCLKRASEHARKDDER